MSYCTQASCLLHRRGVFIRLDLPGSYYPWVHSDLSLCAGILPATPGQAGEVCACGHEQHEAASGALPRGMIAKPRPCGNCPCPDFRHQWQEAA
jgi:hypothetical protein